MLSFVHSIIIIAVLALQASASSGCGRISRRYAGSGQGVVGASEFTAVGVLDFDLQSSTATGVAHVLSNGEIIQADLNGTFSMDSACIITLNLMIGNEEHNLTGLAGQQRSILLTDLTSGTAVTWQWYPAPRDCSASRLSGKYTGVGYVLDGNGEKLEGVVGEARGVGRGEARLTFSTTERPDPTELTGSYQVDSGCTVETSLGFAGVLFSRGVIGLSSVSGGEFVSITVFKS